MHTNTAPSARNNRSNETILQNALFTPQILKPWTEKDTPKSYGFQNNNNLFEVLIPQPYNAINRTKNEKEEILIDLSDDDSQSKSENIVQNEMKDFFPAKQNYNLIDLYEDILATPQCINKNSNNLDHINSRNLSSNTEINLMVRNESAKSPSCLDDLLHSHVQLKENVKSTELTNYAQEIDFIKKINDIPSSNMKTPSVEDQSNIFDKIISNDFYCIKSTADLQTQNQYNPNIKFYNNSEESDTTASEDIDEMIDEVLNMKILANTTLTNEHKIQGRFNEKNDMAELVIHNHSQPFKSIIKTATSSKCNGFQPKPIICSENDTETSSVDIDDLIDDLIAMKTIDVIKVNIDQAKIKNKESDSDCLTGDLLSTSSTDSAHSTTEVSKYEKVVLAN